MGFVRTIVPLAQVKAEQQGWLWPNRIPLGAITLLEGDPGQGKSTITYDLAARVSSGRPLPSCANVRATPRCG